MKPKYKVGDLVYYKDDINLINPGIIIDVRVRDKHNPTLKVPRYTVRWSDPGPIKYQTSFSKNDEHHLTTPNDPYFKVLASSPCKSSSF